MIETVYDFAERYVGLKEISGDKDNPLIMAMLKQTEDMDFSGWPEHDEVPWCSAFANWCAWHMRLPRSKSLRARSWLRVGRVITLDEATADFCTVILKRGSGNQPGPDVIEAPGHVGFYAGVEGSKVLLLAGNQNDEVNVTRFPKSRILGVRRLVRA
jgi:uncharacterized protein (TIGR02594 family)